MSHRVWDHQTFALSEKYQVIACDLRGHGISAKPDCDYSFKEFASDLSDLIETLNLEDVNLVGWSMGESVSLTYMDLYAGKRVKKLVLTGGPIKLSRSSEYPHGIPPDDLEGYLQRKIANRPAEEHDFMMKSFLSPDPHNIDWLVSIAMQTPLDVAIKCVREQNKLDHRETLKKIKQPTLVIFGRHERFYPPSLGPYTVSRLPSGLLKIFENSAHFPFQEEYDHFNRTVDEFFQEE